MQAWIDANGGILATVVLGATLLNLCLSFLQKVLNALKLKEPGWLQKAASVGSSIVAWLSANVPTARPVVAPVVVQVEAPPATPANPPQGPAGQMSNH